MTELPSRARVVVIGGGIIGCSVAYHLAKLGWSDVLLLEQGHLSGGSTWHAAGLVGPLRATEAGTQLVQYSAELYADLEAETGMATGYRGVGGVVVARTEDRMIQLRRTAANAVAYDMECELVGPERAQELWPPMQVDDLLGALWLPGDGKVNPTDVTQSLAKGARMRGVTIAEKMRVLGVDVEETGAGRRVTGVRTDQEGQRIETEIVVNCAGQWAKALGDQVGVTVPLHSAEHFYVVTEAVEGTHPDLPIMRDPDGWTYFKEEVGGLVVGGFEPDAKPWRSPDDLPHPFEFQLLEEDWDHFSLLMDEALVRVPALGETGIRKFYNGPESFTPDNQFLLGAAPELDGYYVGAGFNSVGIASAGGAGRALAEWIVEGEPTTDLVGVDVRRFAPFQADNAWLRSRVAEVLGLHYAIPWPNREVESGRPQRVSPVHDTLAAAGAVFGTKMGWERPNVFHPGGLEYSWGKPSWLAASAAEQRATRGAVAVFDQTSFSKYVVRGPGALGALQWICAADVDVRGRVLRLHAVPQRAGDVRGGSHRHQDRRRRVPDRLQLGHHDPRPGLAAPADAGRPGRRAARHHRRARRAGRDGAGLARPPHEPRGRAGMGEEDFPFATSREVVVAGVTVRATRMTYVGELGWELMVPVADAAAAHAALTEGGAVNAGYYAIDSLRLEKGYRAFGRELTPDLTPVEAGLVFSTALKGDKDFLGRAALVTHRERLAQGGPRRRVASFVLDDPDPMLWGGELVLRDGAPYGQVTSAAWGETVGASVGLALLRSDGPVTSADLERGGFAVDVAGDQHDITVSLSAPLRGD